MNVEKTIFADFFKRQLETRPEVQLPASSGVRGFMEEFRAEVFQALDYEAHELEKASLGTRLSSKIYVIMTSHLSVKLALYWNGTILWLDDHSSDSDFIEFVRREDLISWLPERVHELLELLIETKFSFMGWPQLITSVSDINGMPDQVRGAMSELGEEWLQSLSDADERLSDVADLIHPPTWIQEESGEFILRFCVWTKINGNVVEINCFLGGNSLFRYESAQLTHSVGFYIVPM
jgi:hypothetical protein